MPNGLNPPKLIEHNGETKSIRQWAKSLGTSEAMIRKRLQQGMTPAEALLPSAEQQKQSAGAALKDKVNGDIYQVYQSYGRARFIAWLKEQFDKDPGKAMAQHVYPHLPKETLNPGNANKEQKAIVRIAFMGGHEPQQMILESEG